MELVVLLERQQFVFVYVLQSLDDVAVHLLLVVVRLQEAEHRGWYDGEKIRIQQS